MRQSVANSAAMRRLGRLLPISGLKRHLPVPLPVPNQMHVVRRRGCHYQCNLTDIRDKPQPAMTVGDLTEPRSFSKVRRGKGLRDQNAIPPLEVVEGEHPPQVIVADIVVPGEFDAIILALEEPAPFLKARARPFRQGPRDTVAPRLPKALLRDIQELQVGQVIHEADVLLYVLQSPFEGGLLFAVAALVDNEEQLSGLSRQ